MEENNKEKPVNTGEKQNTKFKEGESGNPNGRPKGQRNYATIYKEALIKLAKLNNKTEEELEEEILSKGLKLAREGDYRFYKDVLDRIHGTAVTRNEHTGKEGKDLFTGLTNEEKAKLDSLIK